MTERLAPPMDRQQRGFWIALACAFLIHSALLVEVNRSAPRRVGAPDGSDNAIAVEIVTEADLKSREAVALPPAGAAPAPPPQPETAPQTAPTPPPQTEAVEAAPAPKEPPPQPKQETAPSAIEPALPHLADVAPLPEKLKPEKPTEKPEEKPVEKQAKLEPAEKQENPAPPEKKKPAPQARLDLTPPSTPSDELSAAPGRNSLATRPPGITRSGENDEFGRGVIRALRATMPQLSGIFGRVTVRLFLNENGNLTDVRVVESSGKSGLDQSVVFATKQSNFPLPPTGATVADRTFLITYVYR